MRTINAWLKRNETYRETFDLSIMWKDTNLQELCHSIIYLFNCGHNDASLTLYVNSQLRIYSIRASIRFLYVDIYTKWLRYILCWYFCTCITCHGCNFADYFWLHNLVIYIALIYRTQMLILCNPLCNIKDFITAMVVRMVSRLSRIRKDEVLMPAISCTIN